MTARPHLSAETQQACSPGMGNCHAQLHQKNLQPALQDRLEWQIYTSCMWENLKQHCRLPRQVERNSILAREKETWSWETPTGGVWKNLRLHFQHLYFFIKRCNCLNHQQTDIAFLVSTQCMKSGKRWLKWLLVYRCHMLLTQNICKIYAHHWLT